MKTLAEKLADLKAKMLVANTDEDRKTISDEIDGIMADAVKVQEKLKTSNKEAETSRKKLEELQKSIANDSDTDNETNQDKDNPDKDTTEKVPVWAKSLTQSVEALNKTVSEITSKEKISMKTEMIKASLKNAGLSETFLKSINVDGEDQEAIDQAVTEFKQALIDEKLLSSEGVKMGEKGAIKNESILDYAKGKNADGGSKTAIVGKKLVPTE